MEDLLTIEELNEHAAKIRNEGSSINNDLLSTAEFPEADINRQSPIFRKSRVLIPEDTSVPEIGAWENIKNHFLRDQTIIGLYRGAKHLISDFAATNYEDEEIPDGWTAFEEKNIIDRPERFWGYILESQSPIELEERRMETAEEAERDEILSSGGLFTGIIGSGLGIISSPDTWALPMLAAAKYAKFGTHVFRGMIETLPALATQGLVHEAIVQSGDVGTSTEKIVLDSMRDTAFGTALYGAGRAVTFGSTGASVWKSRKIINASYDGINVRIGVDEQGRFTGLVAEAMDDSVGAARVNQAQAFLDDGASFNGLTTLVGKLNNIPIVGSPLIQGLTSPWQVVRQFANRIGNESVVTNAMERGIPREITASEILRDITNSARQAEYEIQDLYIQSLGLKPGVIGSAKSVIKQFQDGLSATRTEFNSQVQNVVLTGEKSATREVNEAAKIMDAHLEKVYKNFLEVFDLPTNILPSRTAKGYLMRNYNTVEMSRNPDKFKTVVSNALEIQDLEINKYKQPINDLKAKIKVLNEELKTPGGRKERDIINEINRTKTQLKNAENDLTVRMRNGEIDPALLDDRIWLTNTEHKELSDLIAPINALKKRIENTEKELPGLNKNEQIASRKKIKEMKVQLSEMNDNLTIRANQGEINNKFYTKSSKGFIKFRDVDEQPRFRKTYEDANERMLAAQGYYDKILNLTPEQVNSSVLGKMSGASASDPAMARTLLIPDTVLVDAGFLSNDLGKMLQIYSRTLGKRISLKTIYKDLDMEDGLKSITENLAIERQLKEDSIVKNITDKKKRDKELDKLSRDFEKGKKYLSDAYNYFMGNHIKYTGMYRVSRALKNLSAITMLRNVPLLQIGEIGGIVFKQGLWPVVTGGLIPLIKRMNAFSKDKTYLENAAHARVGLEIELNKYMNSLYEAGAMEQIPGSVRETIPEKFIEGSARLSQRVFMTAQITNFLQRFSANVTQSRVMADLFAAQKGTLGKAGQRRLLMNGIDPKDASKYIEAYKKAGGHKLHGGYVSNWYLWDDIKLSSNMRRAINNDIQGSVLEAGLLDKPFWTSMDPLGGLVFQFMGYLYAAFNKFTVPMLQSPDTNKITGLLMMISLGAMVEPFRKWQKNEEFVIDSEKQLDQWFVSGILESGVMGYPAELIEMTDAALDIKWLERYKQDKFRRRPMAGLIAGPSGGYLQNVADVASSFVNNEINQNDLMKIRNITPIPINMFLDKAITKMIRGTDFPETRADAKQ